MNKLPCILALAFLCGACDTDPPEPRFGIDILGLEYELVDINEGIHPNNGVLANEANPFRLNPIGIEARFEILNSGAAAGTFYAWATQLAREPSGEAQYYTALGLARIAVSGAVVADTQEQADADSAVVFRMANAAAISVLANFPDGLTFDPTGTIPFRVAPLACTLLEELNGGSADNGFNAAVPDASLFADVEGLVPLFFPQEDGTFDNRVSVAPRLCL